MSKTETIIVRVDPATKARIEAAAGRQGKSMTTFILEAAEKAARKVEAMPVKVGKPKGRGACPTYFMARCQEAKRGGSGGYEAAGYTLATHLASEAPWDLEEEEWDAALERLSELLMPSDPQSKGSLIRIAYELRDDDAVWAWFEEYLPRCAALIPRRRRRQFLAGVYRACEDETIHLEP